MSLGEIIRTKREKLSLTQDQVADQAGISKPYLSNIETGRAKNPPTDGILSSLESILGFGQGELLHIAHLARTPLDVRESHESLEAQVQKLRGVLKELFAKAPKKENGGIDLDSIASELQEKKEIQKLSPGSIVPVINRVSAGYPQIFTDLDYPPSVADEYVRCPDLHDNQAFAARVVGDSMEPNYREGDIVVFSPNTEPRNTDDCFVRFASDGTTFKRFYLDSDDQIRLQPLNNKYPAQTYKREDITGLWPAVYKIERLRDT